MYIPLPEINKDGKINKIVQASNKFTLLSKECINITYLVILDTYSAYGLISKEFVPTYDLGIEDDDDIWNINSRNFNTRK